MARRRTPNACSFCGKARDSVQRLIAGPGGIFICDECVRLCKEIIAEGPHPRQTPVHPARAPRHDVGWRRRWLPHRFQLAAR